MVALYPLAAASATLLLALASASALPPTDANALQPRADTNLTGYLGAFFLGDKPSVYFYLSNGNNPTSFSALNKGQPVIVPTKGTKGVRDPAIVVGGGSDAGKKWYIIGTDLEIGKVRPPAVTKGE